MNKNDLQNGMKVTYRDGSERYVLNGNLYAFRSDSSFYGANMLSCYSDDLTDIEGDTTLDIMQVYNQTGDLIWQREETPKKKSVTLELTDEQLEKIIKMMEE